MTRYQPMTKKERRFACDFETSIAKSNRKLFCIHPVGEKDRDMIVVIE